MLFLAKVSHEQVHIYFEPEYGNNVAQYLFLFGVWQVDFVPES